MKIKTRVFTLVATMGLLGGTAFAASGSTGAYFSDSHSGTVSGSVGSITISPDSSTYLSFSDLLPGTQQTVSLKYHNSGSSPQDVYLTFPNATALSALNNLGRYGHVYVSNDLGSGPVGVFNSYNLDDNSTRCGAFGNNPLTGSSSPCNPVPNQIKVASNVAPGAYGTVSFTFEYASATTVPASNSWNVYPLPGLGGTHLDYPACVTANPSGDCTNNQFIVNSGDGSGSGLPYAIVATQVGISPSDTGSKF